MRFNRSVPPCVVIPVLIYPDPSAAADWLSKAFGFTIRLRIANHRVQMKAGDGCFTIAEGKVVPNNSHIVVLFSARPFNHYSPLHPDHVRTVLASAWKTFDGTGCDDHKWRSICRARASPLACPHQPRLPRRMAAFLGSASKTLDGLSAPG
jgi:hypothetical protein